MNKPLFHHIDDVPAYVAGDGCTLRELFHPAKHPLPLNYSLAYAEVAPGGRTHDHLLHQSEVYYILSGSATMMVDGQPYPVRAGSAYYIPAYCRQWLQNDAGAPLTFLCIVDPPWTATGEVVFAE